MKHLLLSAATLLGLAFAGSLQAQSSTKQLDRYAIAVSETVMQDAAWKAATVEVLKQKYPHATLHVWKASPDEVRASLAKEMPVYTAFVVKPEEAGVMFTIALHHLCRSLDDDPYGDTFWGVITGYDAPAAKLLAEAQPIAIERALDCSGCDLTAFNEAWRYTEDHRGTMNYWKRAPEAAVQDIPCDTDNTRGVLERLQKDKVQFLSTSGHATQHDWQMGYCGPNMAMVHKEGHLVAQNTKKELYRASCPEPKVYLANGNCLIGDIDRVDCMALSWLRDGGARQFMGYTVTTWYGAQGWGTLGLFVDRAGMTTAAEAFHFTNADVVSRLEKINFPGSRDFRFTKIEKVNMPRPAGFDAHFTAAMMRSDRKPEEVKQEAKDLIGLLHDRDVVCFYGDPALEARIADGRWKMLPPQVRSGVLELGAEAREGVTDGAVWFRFPCSWDYDPAAVIASPELGKPDLTLDNLIRFPNAKPVAGTRYTVQIPAKAAP